MSTDDGKKVAAERVARMDELRQQRDELSDALRRISTCHAWLSLTNEDRHVIRLALDRADRNP